MKYLTMLSLVLLSVLSPHAQIPFEDWEVVQLEGIEIQCGQETVAIDEEFDEALDPEIWGTYLYYGFPGVQNDNALYRRLHRNDSESIFRDENVIIEDGKCIIIMDEAPDDNDEWTGPDDDGVVFTVQRDLNSGVISSKQRFRYGTFEITSKNPEHNGVNTAFWMAHVQELDITDIADHNSFYAATYNEYGNSDVNYSEFINGLDLTEFHNFKAVWTPYSIKWFLDDVKVADIYKYHNSEEMPLDFECGDLIPAGSYHINPKFLDTERSMAVIAWLTAKRKCWSDACECDPDNNPETHCGVNFDTEGFKTQFEIENIKVTQTEYTEKPFLKLNDIAKDIMYANPSQPAKFLVFGDTELHPVHDNMLEDIKNRYTSDELSFLVIVGDLFPANPNYAEAYALYNQKIRAWMDETGIAVWTVPGNHDVESAEGLDLYTSTIGDINWMFQYNGSAFVGILNAQLTPGYVGPGWSNEIEAFGVPIATTRAVDQYLKGSNYNRLFNFTHVPLVWANYACGYDGYMEYYSMLVKRGLTANFAGHIHQYKKEFQCNTRAYEIVSGAGGSGLVGGSNSPPNTYKSTQAYCDVTFNSWEVPHLDLYTSSSTAANSTYSLNAPYSFDMDLTGLEDCDCAKRPLYTDKIKPIINLVERNGTCYSCIENLTRVYGDLKVLMNDEVVTNSVNLGNGQLCFELEEPDCDAKIEVEYVSCESKGSDCGTTKVTFDPKDLQATLESMILEISECEDGEESSNPYVLIQGNNSVTLSTHVVSPGGIVETTEEALPNDQLLVTWDGYLARELIVQVSFEYCGCLIEEEISITIPSCTNGNCCPEGSGFDGANCYFDISVPDGYPLFIWNNNFYTRYGPNGAGDCPPGSVDDGANCYFGQGFSPQYDGFTWEGGFYTHENCDADPQLCCPFGTTWDGANCRYDISVPEGHIPFIAADNGLYVSPNKDGECPPESTPSVIGCYLGTSIPEGLNGFIYERGFYVNEDCDVDKCCPEGTTWNGVTCEIVVEGDDVSLMILDDNRIAIKYDESKGCPNNTTLDESGTYCLTDMSVPSGFDGVVNGAVIEVEPNCTSCCPDGFEFNGSECVKQVSLEGADVYYANGQLAISPDCIRFPQSNNCCPEGFYNEKGDCFLRASTEELTIDFSWSNVFLRVAASNCLEDGKSLATRSIEKRESITLDDGNPNVVIYPNPSEDKFFFDFDSDNFQLHKVSIYNTTGVLLSEISAAQLTNAELELSQDLSPGIYVVTFEFDQYVIAKKIIKL